MPVRVKQRPTKDEDCKFREREWELLRKTITGTLLAWDSPMSLTVEGTDKDQKLRFRSPWSMSTQKCGRTAMESQCKSFDPALIRSTLHQGAGVDLSSWGSWVKTSARTPFMTIRGIISLDAAPSKETQFICLGCSYLPPGNGCSCLYEAVNRLFGLSSFGVQEEEHRREIDAKRKIINSSKLNEFTASGLKGGGKGVDRWPKYFIRIELNAQAPPHFMEDLESAEHKTKLSSIIKVLEAMITSFLTEHQLRPWKHRPREHIDIGSGSQSQNSVNLSLPLQLPTNIKRSEEHAKHKGSLKVTAAAAFGDLRANVKLPSFSHSGNLQVKDSFSGWSRIKGLPREDSSTGTQRCSFPKSPVSELSSAPQNSVASNLVTQHNNTLSDSSEGDGSRPQLLTRRPLTSIPGSVGPQAVAALSYGDDIENPMEDIDGAECVPQNHGQSDRILAWKNPITQTVVKINARTGSVIDDPPKGHNSEIAKLSAVNIVGSQTTRLGMTRATTLQNISVPASAPAEGPWAKAFLDTWNNPVFRRTEEQIPHVSIESLENATGQDFHCKSHCFAEGVEERALAAASFFHAATLTRKGLDSAKLIAQVDKKFILIQMATTLPQQGMDRVKEGNHQTLVLVDQHAADERIRIETLLAELCTTATPRFRHLKSSLGLCSTIETTQLLDSISFFISGREYTLFTESASRFAKWGILYNLTQSLSKGSDSGSNHVYQMIILTLPGLIAERCRSDPKRLLRVLREDIWKRKEGAFSPTEHVTLPLMHISDSSTMDSSFIPPDKTWPCSIQDCPQGILDMLNSRSCRSAIMFNDVLTDKSCMALIKKLAKCLFPFQCAHGRP